MLNSEQRLSSYGIQLTTLQPNDAEALVSEQAPVLAQAADVVPEQEQVPDAEPVPGVVPVLAEV